MDSDTLKALQDSIAHWERNVAAERPEDANDGPDHCALCQKFLKPAIGCDGCPVQEKTGADGCEGSPYWHAEKALSNWSRFSDSQKANAEWHKAAQAELDFLKSLLPVEAVQ